LQNLHDKTCENSKREALVQRTIANVDNCVPKNMHKF
jgi:hypothetical protein